MNNTNDSCAVRIAVRERPLRESILLDNSDGCGSVVNCHPANPNILIVDDRVFGFDNVLYSSVSQQQLYDVVIKPLVRKVQQGFNCTALAYGQTGTGKSYSMGLNSNSFEGENVGIIPRCFRDLFPDAGTDENSEESGKRREICASFIEIYNEKVYDLFAENSTEPIAARGYKFTGGTRKQISSLQDCHSILLQGNKNRHVRPTKMNSQSSRSHAIFSIHLRVVHNDNTVAACLNLVDLAGSEGVRRTGHQGVAMSEGVHINQGLLTIGKVLHAMTMGYKVIPYRDSVLTSVLQDSLSPNSYLTLLACISPHKEDLSETLSTLRFAQTAKQLKYSPQINTILAEIKKNKANTPHKTNTIQRKNGLNTATPKKFCGSALAAPQKPFYKSTINHGNTFTTPSKIRRIETKFNKTEMGMTPKAKEKARQIGLQRVDTASDRFEFNGDYLFNRSNETINSRNSLFSLNISTSTTVEAPTAKPTTNSYSPVVRKCMVEFGKIIDNKMAQMMENIKQTVLPPTVLSVSSPILPTLDTATQVPNTIRQELRSIVKDLFMEQNTVAEQQNGIKAAESGEKPQSINSPVKYTRQGQLFATSSPVFKVPDIPATTIKKDSVSFSTAAEMSFSEGSGAPLGFSSDLSEQTVRNNGSHPSLRRSLRKVNESAVNAGSTSLQPLRRSKRLSIKDINDNRRRSTRLASRENKLETSVQKNKMAPRKPKSKTPAPLLKNCVIASYFEVRSSHPQHSSKKFNLSTHKKAILDVINRGSMKELQLLPQVGQKTAFQIVTQRTLKGKFKSLAEVGKLPIWRGKAWERFSQANMLL